MRTRGIPQSFPAPVRDADGPVHGVNVALQQYDDEELATLLRRITDSGFVWVRQTFYWSRVQHRSASQPLDWTELDRIVVALQRHPQLRLVAVLADDPPIPPDDPERFAEFAAAFAARYGDVVDHYQVWDEPNLTAKWGGGAVNPSAYADLLARTARAVRAADPEARIILAGLAPTTEVNSQNLSDVRYLEQLYQAGAAPTFDIVAGKPYGFDTGPDDRRVDHAVLNFSRLILLREVMVAHGDADKAVWATQWGWNALPEEWDGAPSIWGQTDEATQASHSRAALQRARTEWPWIGAMIIENLQPAQVGSVASSSTGSGAGPGDPRWGFSLLAPDGSPRPVYDAVEGWAHSLADAAPVGGYSADNRWATYEGDWRMGPLGVDVGRWDGGRVSFRFDGTRVALTVRRGPYRAFLYVTVDGQPANALPRDEAGRAYVVLYDTDSTVAEVPLATGLPPGVHAVEVVAEGGEGQWSLVDWRVGAEPVRDFTGWKVGGLVVSALVLITLLARDVRRANWSRYAGAFLAWPQWAQVASVAAVGGLFWASAALSWGRDVSSINISWLRASCLVLSLLTLPVLALLFALRLDLGLALTAVSAPFYGVPRSMLYSGLALPEVLVVLCLAGYATSRIAHLRSARLASDRDCLPSQSTNPPIHQLTSMDYAVGLLALAALVAAAAAEDRRAALFELRTVFLFPLLTYALVRLSRPNERVRQRVVDGLVLGGLGVALVGLVQIALGRQLVLAEGGLARVRSVYPSPNSLGLYLGRVWPLLAAAVLWGRGWRRRAYVLALIPVTLALVLSFSRGALLVALPAAILMMGWVAGGRLRWTALTLALIGALGMIPLLRVPRFAALLDLGRGTTFFRLKLWRSTLRMIQEHPLFGVGPGNFLPAYRTRYVLPVAWEEFNLGHAHNILLDHWTRLGLLGVAAGVAVQTAFWRTLRRRSGSYALRLGLAGSMAALLAHGLVDNSIFAPDLAMAFFCALALTVGDRRMTVDD
jgi:O-antigen ligase